MSGVGAKADVLRAQLNLKNLRRHDPQIEEIIGSTPYVTVYYNTGAEWIKTGIEGPMFLFSRSSTPRYGFFVLNRQGLEYVQEFLTPESDVKVEGEFILYEPHGDADRATGIWIAEERDRVELCRRMEEIRVSSKPAPPPATSLPYNQSIPLDMLFASSIAPQPKPSPPKVSMNHPTLDMLFAASSPPQPTAPKAPGQLAMSPPAGMSLLDSIFKSAQVVASPPPPAPSAPQKPNDAAALLAMIGLGSPLSQAQALPQMPERSPQVAQRSQPAPPAPALAPSAAAPAQSTAAPAGGPKPAFAPPLLSHDIFAALPMPGQAKKSPVVQSRQAPQQTQSAPRTQPASTQSALPAPPRAHPQPQPHVISPAPVRAASGVPSLEEKMAQAILDEKARIAKSISGPPASLAPASVEVKLASQPPVALPRMNGAGLVNGTQPSSVALKKAVVLNLMDELAMKQGVGMEQAEQGVTLGQKDFVRALGEMLQKPAFATALYAKYLERCEED